MNKKLHQEIITLIQNEPSSERVWDLLCRVDEEIQKIINEKFEGKQSDRLEQRLHAKIFSEFKEDKNGFSINDYLDLISKKIDSILNDSENDITSILLKLGIYFKKHSEIFLITDDIEQGIIKGSKEGYIESVKNNKVKSLLNILRELGVYGDDIICHLGVRGDKMMRKYEYIFIQIPNLNRSVLISDGSSSNTFVIKGLPNEDYFFELSKRNIFNDFEVTYVPYTKNWEKYMKDKLQSDFIPKKTTKNKVSAASLRKLLSTFQNTPEYQPKILMSKTAKYLKDLDILGYKLKDISKLLEIKKNENLTYEVRPENKKLHLAYLLRSVFGNSYKCINDVISLHELQQKAPITTIGWEKKFEEQKLSPKILLGKTQPELKEVRVCGFTLAQIAGKINIKDVYKLSGQYNYSGNKYHLACLLQTIFGEGYTVVDNIIKEEKNKIFQSSEQWSVLIKEAYTAKEFMEIVGSKLGKMKISSGESILDIWKTQNTKGKKNFSSPNPRETIYNKALFALEIYGDSYESINKVIERENQKNSINVVLYDWKQAFIDEGLSPESLMKSNTTILREIYIFGYSLGEIAGILSVREKFDLDDRVEVYSSKYFLALLGQQIFGIGIECFDKVIDRETSLQKIPCDITAIKKIFFSNGFNPESLMSMGYTEFKTTEIKGIYFSDILKIKDKEGNKVIESPNPNSNMHNRALFIRTIFGEGYKTVDGVIEEEKQKLTAPKTYEGWKQKFIEKGLIPKEIFSYSMGEIELLKICGYSLGELGSKFEIQKKYNISGNSNPSKNKYNLACLLILFFGKGYEEIDRMFYGKEDWKKQFEKQGYTKQYLFGLSEDQLKDEKVYGLTFGEIGFLLKIKKHFRYNEKSNFYNKNKHLNHLLDFIGIN